MPVFIVERTKAFKVEAENEEKAFEKVNSASPEELAEFHKDAGEWHATSAVYLDED